MVKGERSLPFRSGSGLYPKVSAMERMHDIMTVKGAAVEDMRNKSRNMMNNRQLTKHLVEKPRRCGFFKGPQLVNYNPCVIHIRAI